MKLIVEAKPGLVRERPDLVVDALLAVATAEGATASEFREALAKAAGATRVHQHASERSKYQVVDACAAEAKRLYETAMTIATNEIVDVLIGHLTTINLDDVRSLGR